MEKKDKFKKVYFENSKMLKLQKFAKYEKKG
jgi:hypothetical protein